MAVQLDDNLIGVGQIRGVYGVKGWVRLFSWTSPRENILKFSHFITPNGALELLEGKVHGKALIGRVRGVDDREAALALSGTDLSIPRDALPAADEGEFYWTDLVGLEVRRIDDELVGKVDYLLETGSNDVLVVALAKGGEELIPFLMDTVIKQVDLSAGVIRVDWDLPA